MEIYIKIQQTAGTDTLRVRFPEFKNNSLFYGDGEVAFGELNDANLNYQLKYSNDVISSDELTLEIYEIDSDELIYTIRATADSVDNTPTLSCAITAIDLGIGETTDILTSPAIEVTGANLIDDIVLTQNDDRSFYITADNGVTWWYDRIPLDRIVWTTPSTFDIKLKRNYTNTWGVLEQDVIFSNAGNSFTISTTSEFEIDNIHAQDSWNKGDGVHSIVMRNDGDPNTTIGDHSLVIGTKNANQGGRNSFIGGDSNTIRTTANNSAIVAGVRNTIDIKNENTAILSGERNRIKDNSRNSSILGGSTNIVGAGSENSTIIGGTANEIDDGVTNAVIIGGTGELVTSSNTVTFPSSTTVIIETPPVGPGAIWQGGAGTQSILALNDTYPNESTGNYSLASGGYAKASGLFSRALGHYTEALGPYSFAGGIGNSTYRVKASGLNAFNFSRQSSTTVQSDNAGNYGAILGGADNNITSQSNYGIVIGGYKNNLEGDYSSIIGGYNNSVDDTAAYSTIIGGRNNTITGDRSVILGGNGLNAPDNDTVYVPKLWVNSGEATIYGAGTVVPTLNFKIDGEVSAKIHMYDDDATDQYFDMEYNASTNIFKMGPDSHEDAIAINDAGNVTINEDLTLTSGDITLTSGDITLTSGGITENGTILKRKILSIGNWDMQTNSYKEVTHNISSAIYNIVSVDVLIMNDALNRIYPINFENDTISNSRISGSFQINTTTIKLHRVDDGAFNSTFFNDNTIVRGNIFITYIS